MLEIAEFLEPTPTELWPLLQQLGVTKVVGAGVTPQTVTSSTPTETERAGSGSAGGSAAPWSTSSSPASTTCTRSTASRGGRDRGLPAARARAPGTRRPRREIAWFQTQIRSMGRLGIRALCYHWMAVFSWSARDRPSPSAAARSSRGTTTPWRRRCPGSGRRSLTEERLWDNIRYFLQRVLPVAEQAGVQARDAPRRPADLPDPRRAAASCAAWTGFQRSSTWCPAGPTASRSARATSR